MYAYADDLIIISDSMDAMKEAIVKLLAFCRANYLQVNPKKSELLLMCGQVRRSSIAGNSSSNKINIGVDSKVYIFLLFS